jgi:phosphopantothenate---cysteine ligase (CTP)
MPFAVVTCGPAHEPIDEVRRITNHSTGELGTMLSESLLAAGFEVLCLRGEGAGYRPPENARVVPFSTNASIKTIFEQLTTRPQAIFHAAALCDFRVHSIEGAREVRKIRSTTSEVHLILKPAEKILPQLRSLFLESVIVGWKYELEGSRQAAIERAREQLAASHSDACVVNGSAYGSGFGVLRTGRDDLQHLPNKPALCKYLTEWTLQTLCVS